MNENKKMIIYLMIFIIILVIASILYNSFSKKGEETVQNKLNEVTAEIKTEAVQNENSLDFDIYNENGEKVSLSEFKGKPTVINFWASWCYYCNKEMPDFQEVYNQEKDNVNFIMLDVPDGVQETQEKALKFIRDNNYTFPIYFDSEFNGVNMFQIKGYPTTVFLDKDLNISSVYPSMISKEKLIEKINGLK